MPNRKKAVILTVAFILYSALIALVFYLAGLKSADDSYQPQQTFYATISDISGNTLTVRGMEVNDINFRSEFSFTITDNTRILWRYTDISAQELEPGDNISVTFTGEILETDPARINDVVLIQLLDDEK